MSIHCVPSTIEIPDNTAQVKCRWRAEGSHGRTVAQSQSRKGDGSESRPSTRSLLGVQSERVGRTESLGSAPPGTGRRMRAGRISNIEPFDPSTSLKVENNCAHGPGHRILKAEVSSRSGTLCELCAFAVNPFRTTAQCSLLRQGATKGRAILNAQC